MTREWTDDEVSAEIAKAVQIVREDRLEQFLRTRFKVAEENHQSPKPDGPTPPPPKKVKDDSPEKQPPARKSIWWGEASTEGDD